MSDTAIRIDGLSKAYRIGLTENRPNTLIGTAASLLIAPIQNWRRLRRLNTSFANGQADDIIWALRNVSLEITQGEVVAIIGRNGAGKSTLLKLLSRITEPTSGRITIRGRVSSLLEVGTGFHPELTGRDNIYMNGTILGMRKKEIDRSFDEIVAFSGVEQFIDTPIKRYSSGMQVRLAFSVAAHLDPEILLIDEVLAVGDAAFQKKCLSKMHSVSRSGRTILFVSHNMNAVESLCSSGFYIRDGHLAFAGAAVRDLTNRYLSDCTSSTRNASWTNTKGNYANAYFEPLELKVLRIDGTQLTEDLPNNEGALVEIRGRLSVLDPSLTIGYAIYSEDGTLLYWSYHTDGPPSHWPELHPGEVTLRSRIPPHLLNEGGYRLELIGGLHFREWLFEPQKNVPSVAFAIRGGLSTSPYWMQRRPGHIAPIMQWHIV